jgi:flagellar biosynthesis chaperone FliJ
MSTSTVIARRVIEEKALEELRRLEAERARLERKRLGIARQGISTLDKRFRELVSRRDQAAQQLPDLSLQAPPWPSLSDSQRENVLDIENYLIQLQTFVDDFENNLNADIRLAQAILADRLARAEALRDVASLENAIQISLQNVTDILQILGENPLTMSKLKHPGVNASLESLKDYIAVLQFQVTQLEKQTNQAQRRLTTRRKNQELIGSLVDASSQADIALTAYETEQFANTRQVLQAVLNDALVQSGLKLSALPSATQTLLQAAVNASEVTSSKRERIYRLVARERTLQDHRAEALRMMQATPNLVHANVQLAQRWNTLLQQLQMVYSSIVPLSPDHFLAYEQIKADAQRELDRMYVEIDFVNALRDQNFNVQYDENGGLIIEDLNNAGVWFKETMSLETEQGRLGGMGSVLELRTDALENDGIKDEQIIANVCDRLQLVGCSTSEVESECEVIERKDRINRERRPARRKAFTARI